MSSYNLTPLHYASYIGCKDTVKLLLTAGADPNSATTNELVPLHIAAKKAVPNDRADVVKLLLDAGARPDSTDAAGWTPLTWAIRRWNKELIEIFFNARRGNREK